MIQPHFVSDQAWARQKYNKVMLDPSRAGASEVLHNLKKWDPELVMYVSCNPSTLARDAGILVNDLGYTLVNYRQFWREFYASLLACIPNPCARLPHF
jgi:tRNA/tmRNA/rRNA uracil-C5-methylase (TrmA/RlmC/RlmD family)